MPEIEIHAHHGEHESNPLVLPVSLTISILAVVVAAATLMGHRAHTEELVFQGKATDQWNFYQAKNIRMHEMEVMVDLLGSVTTDRKSTRLNSSHTVISYAVFCLKKKKIRPNDQ